MLHPIKNVLDKFWAQCKEKFEPDPPGWQEFVEQTIAEAKRIEAMRIKNGISDDQWQAQIEQIFSEFIEQLKVEQDVEKKA